VGIKIKYPESCPSPLRIAVAGTMRSFHRLFKVELTGSTVMREVTVPQICISAADSGLSHPIS